jgi:thymidine kinase
MAKLYFRYGTMAAGKTIDLLKVAYNYQERGMQTLLLASGKDNRYGVGRIQSRIGVGQDAVAIEESTLIWRTFEEYVHNNGKPDCVLVEEVQFFNRGQIHALREIVDAIGIPVICYGLRTDYKGMLFPGSDALMCLADKIEEIKTVCWCGRKATMNGLTRDRKLIYEGEQFIIDNEENRKRYKYVALCYKHWASGEHGLR